MSTIGNGCACCTLRAYGVLALPMSGTSTLLFDPSAVRHWYSLPRYVAGGCGRSLYTISGKTPISPRSSPDAEVKIPYRA